MKRRRSQRRRTVRPNDRRKDLQHISDLDSKKDTISEDLSSEQKIYENEPTEDMQRKVEEVKHTLEESIEEENEHLNNDEEGKK